MIKFILFLVFLYFTFRFIFSIFGMNIARMAAKEAVKGAQNEFYQSDKKGPKNPVKSPDNKQIEDIDYEEIK